MYGFSLFISLGMTLGLAWSIWQAPAFRRRDFPITHEIMTAGLLASPGMLLGARLFFICLHWAYYQQHFGEVFLVSAGGLFWAGAVVGGFAGLCLAAYTSRCSLGRLADGLLPFILATATGAWLGCWLDGCFYGMVADSVFSLPAIDEWGQYAGRFPVQLCGAAATLVLYGLLAHFSGRLAAFPGSLAGLAVSGVAIEVFGLSFLRADRFSGASAARLGLSLDGWAALLVLALAGAALWFIFTKRKVEAG